MPQTKRVPLSSSARSARAGADRLLRAGGEGDRRRTGPTTIDLRSPRVTHLTVDHSRVTLLDEPAPDFEFASTAGENLRLSDTLDDGPTVVVTFRGTWCSYCAEQLQTFSELEYDMWRHLGVDGWRCPTRRFRRCDRCGGGSTFHSTSSPIPTSRRPGGTPGPKTTTNKILRPATFIVDTDGVVRYEHLGEHPGDRTYATRTRAAIRHHDCRGPLRVTGVSRL